MKLVPINEWKEKVKEEGDATLSMEFEPYTSTTEERNSIRSEIEMDGNYRGASQPQGGGEGVAGDNDSSDWRTWLLPGSRRRIVNKIMEMLQKHIPVHGQDTVQWFMEAAVRLEEKMYNAAKSQDDYLKKITLKMLKVQTEFENPMANSLHPNTASSGQNAHGPEMTMEATSYEPTSGPEDSDEDAKEEKDGDVSKEDVGEEVVVRKERNSFVGHRENARVGENEESSSNEAIGRPSVFFK